MLGMLGILSVRFGLEMPRILSGGERKKMLDGPDGEEILRRGGCRRFSIRMPAMLGEVGADARMPDIGESDSSVRRGAPRNPVIDSLAGRQGMSGMSGF